MLIALAQRTCNRKYQQSFAQSWFRRISGMLTGQRGRVKAVAEIKIYKYDRECDHQFEKICFVTLLSAK